MNINLEAFAKQRRGASWHKQPEQGNQACAKHKLWFSAEHQALICHNELRKLAKQSILTSWKAPIAVLVFMHVMACTCKAVTPHQSPFQSTLRCRIMLCSVLAAALESKWSGYSHLPGYIRILWHHLQPKCWWGVKAPHQKLCSAVCVRGAEWTKLRSCTHQNKHCDACVCVSP